MDPKNINVFSDEDIEKYRIIVKTNDPTHQDWWLALLVRLEAAEAIADIANSKDAYTSAEWVQRFTPALEAWRRVSGK